MIRKEELLESVATVLNRKSYKLLFTYGCFDIVAKKDELLLIKVLANIDGFLEEHAKSIRAAAHFLSAYPFVISVSTSRSTLCDDVVYFRFDLPVVTPNTFEKILEKEEVKRISVRGKHVVEIETEKLRKRRLQLNLSLKQLASLVGISKKAMYEIENKRVNPTEETIKKLEKVLDIDLKRRFEPIVPKRATLKPKNEFERIISLKLEKLGIDNTVIYSTAFNLVGRKTFSLISIAEKKIKAERLDQIKKLSEFLSVYAFGVSREKIDTDVPVLSEQELRKINSLKELIDAIEQ